MKYFFILGNNPALSIAELSCVFGESSEFKLTQANVILLEPDKEIDPGLILKRIGGVIKFGEITKEIKDNNFIDSVKPLFKPREGKYKFGISCYSKKQINIKPLAMNIKKYLKEKGVSSRWVTSKEPILSSVIVEQNKLTSAGLEIVIINKGKINYIGKTSAVQPFKDLSFRDYGRPARDDLSGMLPPKLAQIMINLSLSPKKDKKGKIILDPFCGSGTILTEAILLGYKNLIGSDISRKAIDDTKNNIDWIKKKYKINIKELNIFQSDVLNLSKELPDNSIDAIVTEPYLGPQRGRLNYKKILPELQQLYSNTFKVFYKLLKKNGRVIIVLPIFTQLNQKKINPNFFGLKIINPLPDYLINNKLLNITNRDTIIYGRAGQKVWREIIVLEKI